jgi:hypothetical protein
MKAIVLLYALLSIQFVFSQDKIYKRDRTIVEGKVDEVTYNEIKYRLEDSAIGPLYVMRIHDMDSIVYGNGRTDYYSKMFPKKDYSKNIEQLNTWSLNHLGLLNFAVTQSYERRFKKSKRFALKVILSIGYQNGGPAGYGVWLLDGKTTAFTLYHEGSFSVASGFQPKIYLNNGSKVRFSVGPEVMFGYATITDSYGGRNDVGVWRGYEISTQFASFTTTSIFGIHINPVPKLSIVIDGGLGYGLFFNKSSIRHTGTWRVGVGIGTNF